MRSLVLVLLLVPSLALAEDPPADDWGFGSLLSPTPPAAEATPPADPAATPDPTTAATTPAPAADPAATTPDPLAEAGQILADCSKLAVCNVALARDLCGGGADCQFKIEVSGSDPDLCTNALAKVADVVKMAQMFAPGVQVPPECK